MLEGYYYFIIFCIYLWRDSHWKKFSCQQTSSFNELSTRWLQVPVQFPWFVAVTDRYQARQHPLRRFALPQGPATLGTGLPSGPATLRRLKWAVIVVTFSVGFILVLLEVCSVIGSGTSGIGCRNMWYNLTLRVIELHCFFLVFWQEKFLVLDDFTML